MDVFLEMSPEDRRLACTQAAERIGLQAVSIEKDLWVCWTLRELAGLPDLGSSSTVSLLASLVTPLRNTRQARTSRNVGSES